MEIIDSQLSYKEFLEHAYARRKERGEEDATLIDILKEVFEDNIHPDEAANRVSSFVFSHDDFLSVYAGVLSTIVSAAHELSEEDDLHRLANLVLALSRLGDARNKSDGALCLSFESKTCEIEPNQVIEVDDGKIWSDLPHFMTNFCEDMQGILSLHLDTNPHYLTHNDQVLQHTSISVDLNILPNKNGQTQTPLPLFSSTIVAFLHARLITCIHMAFVPWQSRWNGILGLRKVWIRYIL